MSSFNIVAATTENTVVTSYEPVTNRSDSYQSEAALEREFIQLLTGQGYEYLTLHTEANLIANLRRQLEAVNDFSFTDGEWQRFFADAIANPNEHIVEKTRKIQEDFVQVLRRDDGTSKNISLIDKKNIHNNRLQVINQYEVGHAQGARHDNRYDVTILVNGLPLVHIELKRRGVAIREAFHQIDRYQRDSFWAGCGLFEYVQIFVISNGTNTKYYSNSTRFNAIREASGGKAQRKKTSNSFEFTSFWADATNKIIPDLIDFTRTFFARHTLLNVLTRYCVFTSENLLLVMRPYQITATERILNRIQIATNYKKYGTIEGGGYIWHTTGSGKTLTSFKTARLASQLPYIDKVLFVVDRKDLDYTAEEMEQLFEAARGHRLELIIQFAAFYGLRRGEVLGLRWDAIDFAAGTFTIRHTVTTASVEGKHLLIQADRAKTKSSLRTLPLVEGFAQRLRALKEQQKYNEKLCGNCYNQKFKGYLFVDEMGNLILPNTVTDNFAQLLKEHGLRKIRFHDLRHSCASLLLKQGVPMKHIQEWLGHSDISTTANIYAHLDSQSKQLSAATMEKALALPKELPESRW